jgi:thiol-disulfide isomerase/thioredoxin
MFGTIQSTFKSSNIGIILLVIILLITFIVIGYYTYNSVKPKQLQANLQSSNATNKTAKLMLFFVDWCPHCKVAKPEWNDLKNEYVDNKGNPIKQINGYYVQFEEYDCTNETPQIEKMMNQYNIEGYPTIKLIKDNEVIEYDAKPTKDTLNVFLNSVL